MRDLVLAVSPNTSTDRISVVRGFHPGATLRTRHSFDQAGGSGTHAAGVITQLGGASVAVAVIGGGNGRRWRMAAERQGIPAATVEIEQENRSSFVLIDEERGKVAEIIDPGPSLGSGDLAALAQLIEAWLPRASLLLLSGSLPPGVPDHLYARCTELARAVGVSTIVDAHSGPLAAAVKARPWLIKPNLEEFHQLVGASATTMPERIALLDDLAGEIAEVVLLSMEAEGALLAIEGACWQIEPPAKPVTLPGSDATNPVGCGDALVGAFCDRWLRSHDLVESARWGTAAAHVNLGQYEVPSCPPDEVARLVRQVEVRQIRGERSAVRRGALEAIE